MFKFRLDPLITIRENALKECQRELAKAYEARQIVEDERLKIEQNIAENTQSCREMLQSKNINVRFLIGVREHEAYLLTQLEELHRVIKEVDAEIERRRALVAAANKELKIVEKLKEKRYEKYLEEENTAETKFMDEVAGNRRVRS